MGRRRLGGSSKRRGAAVVGATAIVAAPPVNEDWLVREFFGQHVPESENWRQHYGKALDLALIDTALRQAEQGQMVVLTDIGRETNSLDGHLSSVLQKRLNRLTALPYEITPATGRRINPKKAEAYASYVRDQLEQVPRFKQALGQLAWGVFDGRAANELQWLWLDGDWTLSRLDWIHPRRLSFGAERDVRVVDTQSMSFGGFRDVGFPIEQVPYKFIVYKPQLFCDYPEREGLGIRCLYWSRFARFGVHERNLLLELFGRPWRIIKHVYDSQGKPVAANMEGTKQAFETVKQLGYNTTARLPPGFDVDIHAPFTGAGQVSNDVIDYCNKIISKLVLGNTGTTDAVSTGLGSTIGNAHVSEEDLIVAGDAERLGEVVEDHIVDAIIAANFGPDEVIHAPKFSFVTEAPASREEEGRILAQALGAGVPISLEQARERLGIREVKPGEPYIVNVQRPAEFGQLAQPPAPAIVYPVGRAPEPGEVAAPPLLADGLPPGGETGQSLPTLPVSSTPPGGTIPAAPAPALGPDEDEPDSVAALCEKMNELGIEECPHKRKNRCDWCGIMNDRDVEMGADGQPKWIVRWRPLRRQPPVA